MKITLDLENFDLRVGRTSLWQEPLSVRFELGKVHWIAGENGSGKSTLLRSLRGLHSNYGGEIKTELGPDEIFYLPQVFAPRSQLPLQLGDIVAKSEMTQPSKGWNSSSGGERQLALIEMALARKEQMLLLDEPFNHLDHGKRVFAETRLQAWLNEDRANRTVLIVHHGDWKTDSERKPDLVLQARSAV